MFNSDISYIYEGCWPEISIKCLSKHLRHSYEDATQPSPIFGVLALMAPKMNGLKDMTLNCALGTMNRVGMQGTQDKCSFSDM